MIGDDDDDDWEDEDSVWFEATEGKTPGQRERDEAMERVARGSPEYMSGGMVLIGTLEEGIKVIGEDVRIQCLASGLRYHHPNVHGALIREAMQHGLLIRTGSGRHMRTPHNHARRSPEYWVRRGGPIEDIVERLHAMGDMLCDEAAQEIRQLRRLLEKGKK